MTLLEIETRKHHCFVARELIKQAISDYDLAGALVRSNEPGDVLRSVLAGDMKLSRAMENLNEVSE